jgi:hypothetical protein
LKTHGRLKTKDFAVVGKERFMKRLWTLWLGSILVLIAGLTPLLAHHGRGSTYDGSKQISIKGVVKQVLWRNPHIGIVIDVKDPSGKVTSWAIEHSNVSTLARLGYGRNSLPEGAEVTAVINPGSKGEPIGLCRKIVLADGKEIFQRGANASPID